MTKFGVVVFPGSNCDRDAHDAITHVLGERAEFLWHKDTSVGRADVIILPGGFAHGDYLRTGAIARFSPIMTAVEAFADAGGPVLGICNGFQILCESGLLPGAMLRNRGLKFICEHVFLRVEETDTPFTRSCRRGQILSVPINHGEGNYFAQPDVMARLESERRIIFRYTDADGEVVDSANPNGSAHSVAGVCSVGRNVVGMMPHPERACDTALGSADGLVLFESVVSALARDGQLAQTASPAGSVR